MTTEDRKHMTAKFPNLLMTLQLQSKHPNIKIVIMHTPWSEIGNHINALKWQMLPSGGEEDLFPSVIYLS